MSIKETKKLLEKYQPFIAVAILIMLVTLSILTIENFKKQNEIIETGGYTDGKIRCVCTQDAWDMYQHEINISEDIIWKEQG